MTATLPASAADKKRTRFAKCDASWLSLDLTARELRVLLALSLHADWRATGHGRCFPKRDTLALATKLQVSHISEAVRSLSEEHGLITVVRLGRKNVYYVRAIGKAERMPPSDAIPFFSYLGSLGIHISQATDGQLFYLPESKKLEPRSLLLAILSDYVKGLVPLKLHQAFAANHAITEDTVIS